MAANATTLVAAASEEAPVASDDLRAQLMCDGCRASSPTCAACRLVFRAAKALDEAREERDAFEIACDTASEMYRQLHALVHNPEMFDFLKALPLEAAYQVERWGDGDRLKKHSEWFWLIGRLASKALDNPRTTPANAVGKRLHRIITIAAAAYNWHKEVCRRENIVNEQPEPHAATQQ